MRSCSLVACLEWGGRADPDLALFLQAASWVAPKTQYWSTARLADVWQGKLTPCNFPAGLSLLTFVKIKGTSLTMLLLFHVWLKFAYGLGVYHGWVGKHMYYLVALFSFRKRPVSDHANYHPQWRGQVSTPAHLGLILLDRNNSARGKEEDRRATFLCCFLWFSITH